MVLNPCSSRATVSVHKPFAAFIVIISECVCFVGGFTAVPIASIDGIEHVRLVFERKDRERLIHEIEKDLGGPLPSNVSVGVHPKHWINTPGACL